MFGYNEIESRFLDRQLLKNPLMNVQEVKRVFNEDYTDSDGDGYSNLFERAIASDSLGTDRFEHLPSFPVLNDNRPRISFVRYSKDSNNSTQSSAGEEFFYHVEQSYNLQTWGTYGLSLKIYSFRWWLSTGNMGAFK